MRVAAIILAGGAGKRFSGVPKQFHKIGGKPMLAITLSKFTHCDEIIVAANPEHIDETVAIVHSVSRGDLRSPANSRGDLRSPANSRGDLRSPANSRGDLRSPAKASVFASGVRSRGRCPHRPDCRPPAVKVITGGATRTQSARNALAAVSAEIDCVLIHDAARPFVTPDLVGRVIAELENEEAVCPVIPVTDTLRELDGDYFADTTTPEVFCRVQTPQGFRRKTIVNAYEKLGEGVSQRDDAAVAMAAGARVKTIAGEASNIKVTTADDLATATSATVPLATAADVRPQNDPGLSRERSEAAPPALRADIGAGAAREFCRIRTPQDDTLLRELDLSGDRGGNLGGVSPPEIFCRTSGFRVGIGFDAHRFAPGKRLVLCGVEIPHGKGLEAHSDGDVAAHALIDALLGAAGEGDIGSQFPDKDEQYKDVSSMALLEKTMTLLAKKGYVANNADITLVLEKPRLAPYVPAMKKTLALALALPETAVGIKATTTERLGFSGREEGIAAEAIVSLRPF